MAANTLTQQFVSGTTGTTQATAQASFNTALAAIVIYPNSTPLQILNSGVEVTLDGSQALNYSYWAFVQYYSNS